MTQRRRPPVQAGLFLAAVLLALALPCGCDGVLSGGPSSELSPYNWKDRGTHPGKGKKPQDASLAQDTTSDQELPLGDGLPDPDSGPASPDSGAPVPDSGAPPPSPDSGTLSPDSGAPPPSPDSGTSSPDLGPIPVGALFVDPVNGNNANPGTELKPWRTLKHAFAQLGGGDTLVLRGGRYNEKDLDLTASGTATQPTTVRGYPGEQPIIDASYKEFRTVGNSQWVLVDAATQLYRSVGTSYGSDAFVGKLVHQGSYYNLVVYSDMENDGLANISSTNENVSTGVRYVGPGLYNNGGQLYIRLQPHSPAALHGKVLNIPANPDPRQNALYICDETTVVNIAGSYIEVLGVDVAFGRHGFAVDASAHHVTIANLTINVPYIAVSLKGGAHHITVDNVDIESSFPPWLAWTDMKGSDGQSQPGRHWNNKSAGVNGSGVHDVEIKNSRFNRVFDGSTMTGYNIHIHHNDYVVLDDMIQLGTNAYNVELDHNNILGAGPSHNGEGSSPQPGTKYVHHNVINTDIEMLWGKNDPSGILRTNYSGWHGQTAIPTHTSSNIGSGDPWKIYYNTILYNGAKRSGGCGVEQWTTTNSTGAAHEVYNNILVELGGGTLVEEYSTQGGPQIYDGNVYYRVVSSSKALMDDFEDSKGSHDYGSLAQFLASSTFQESKQLIATGWEAHGVEADPMLDAERYPSTSSPAASGAVPLPAQLPGPRHAYRGALPPR